MKLRPRPQEPQPETILPLIDVVFFLLVFFLLIGRMDATAPFEVSPPFTAIGTDLPGGGATLVVATDGRIALDGRPTDEADAMAALTAQLAARPDLRVRINADAQTALRHVLPMVAGLEAAGARDIVLVVTPEEK